MKRTAASQAKSSTSKKGKVTLTPVQKKFNTVMAALTDEETVVPGPESCRAMLVAIANAALKIPKDERHADQATVFTMLTEIFAAEKGRWEARVADAKSAVEKATVERTEKMDVKDAADAELKIHKDVVGQMMDTQSKATEVVQECKDEHSAALTLRGDADAKKQALVKTHEHGLVIQEKIKGLKEGIYEIPKEMKQHITEVCALFESLGAEEALVKTLPQILRRKPEERGSFDDMALQQLDLYLNSHLSSLSSNIEAADATVAEHETAVTAWEATVEVAENKKTASDEALQAAQTQQEHLQEALTGARKVLKEHTAILKSQNSDLATEQFGLHSVEDVLGALEFLNEYIVPALVPEEEKEADELPAETAVEMEVEKEQLEVASVEIPTAKVKEIEVAMNFHDMPSPSKKARHSVGASIPMVVA